MNYINLENKLININNIQSVAKEDNIIYIRYFNGNIETIQYIMEKQNYEDEYKIDKDFKELEKILNTDFNKIKEDFKILKETNKRLNVIIDDYEKELKKKKWWWNKHDKS